MNLKTSSLVAMLLAIPAVQAAGINSVLSVLTLDFIDVTDQTRMIALLRIIIFIISFTILYQAFKRAGKFTSEGEGILGKLIGTKPHEGNGLFESRQAGIIAFVMAVMVALFMPSNFLLTILSVYTTATVLLFVLVPFLWAINYARKVESVWIRLAVLLIALWALSVISAFSSTGISSIPGMSFGQAANLENILLTVVGIAQLLIVIGIVISIIQMFGGKSSGHSQKVVRPWEDAPSGRHNEEAEYTAPKGKSFWKPWTWLSGANNDKNTEELQEKPTRQQITERIKKEREYMKDLEEAKEIRKRIEAIKI